MEKTKWKIVAIVFITLFTLLLLFNIWGISLYMAETDSANECYYDICKDSVDAYYSENVCYCMDSYGNTLETKYMK